jgi:hypothetical protein
MGEFQCAQKAGISEHILAACIHPLYRVADKSLAPPGKKQATATEDFDFHLSYL